MKSHNSLFRSLLSKLISFSRALRRRIFQLRTNMSIPSQLALLRASLTSDCEILENPHDANFREYLKRWSDIDLKKPAAIVLPSSEDNIQKTVRCLLADGRMGRAF